MQPIIYSSDAIANEKRDFGEASEYYPAMIDMGSIGARPALFTSDQLDVAMDRARRNPHIVEIAARNARSVNIVIASALSIGAAALVVLGIFLADYVR